MLLGETSGATNVTVLVTPTTITCASVGDSRAVLCRDGHAVALAHDHKPINPIERERIEKGGGFVRNNRVNGRLAMSRAMGDFRYKNNPKLAKDRQLVVAVPDVIEMERNHEKDEFLVVACDGIFDVLSNQELVDAVRELLATNASSSSSSTTHSGHLPLKDLCRKLCLQCQSSHDNTTVVIVRFKQQGTLVGDSSGSSSSNRSSFLMQRSLGSLLPRPPSPEALWATIQTMISTVTMGKF